MEFFEKGTMDPMNGHFSPINGLKSVNGIQFSLCGTLTNLIFAHREVLQYQLCTLALGRYVKLGRHLGTGYAGTMELGR